MPCQYIENRAFYSEVTYLLVDTIDEPRYFQCLLCFVFTKTRVENLVVKGIRQMHAIPVASILSVQNLKQCLVYRSLDGLFRFSVSCEHRAETKMAVIDAKMFANFFCKLIVRHLSTECEDELVSLSLQRSKFHFHAVQEIVVILASLGIQCGGGQARIWLVLTEIYVIVLLNTYSASLYDR